jgi:hypothetical protein
MDEVPSDFYLISEKRRIEGSNAPTLAEPDGVVSAVS